MNKISDLRLFSAIALSMAIGCVIPLMIAYGKLEDNSIGGYPCTPIVKVKTLEEAKAIIEAHQKRIGGIK